MKNSFEQNPKDFEKPREVRESKEKEVDPELAAAIMMERADSLVKEVKTNKQQIQNIMLHMAQVKQAIKKIRQQLQLQQTTDGDNISPDEKQINKLRVQISDYREELFKMKDDLIEAYTNELPAHLDEVERREEATKIVNQLLAETN